MKRPSGVVTVLWYSGVVMQMDAQSDAQDKCLSRLNFLLPCFPVSGATAIGRGSKYSTSCRYKVTNFLSSPRSRSHYRSTSTSIHLHLYEATVVSLLFRASLINVVMKFYVT